MFAPVLLAVMCELRRGEITALRWGSVDLVGKQLSVVESTEQTRRGVRSKETKSGRTRAVALPAWLPTNCVALASRSLKSF
jgi:integrase